MSNNEKKKENDSLRTLQRALNSLTSLKIEKDKVVEEIPEVSAIDRYKEDNIPAVVEDEEYSNKIEQVAALQFLGKSKEEICEILSIDPKTFKEICLDVEFQNVKKRLAEDKKVYILSKLLDRVDEGMGALSDLIGAADEDRTRLNAVALLLEQTNRLLDEQKTNSGGNSYADLLKRANIPEGEVEQVNLAQIIMRQRSERGLK